MEDVLEEVKFLVCFSVTTSLGTTLSLGEELLVFGTATIQSIEEPKTSCRKLSASSTVHRIQVG